MKNFYRILFLFLILFRSDLQSANWCKAIYQYSEQAFDGNFQKQLSLCKSSDNLFLSIASKYKNASHLLNASIANYCDLNKQIIKSQTTKVEKSYYSAVCVFRKHKLRTK